jgi:DNA modification methylase
MSRTRLPRREMNKLLAEDRPAHEWYRFVLSFPPHLVRTYLQRFRLGKGQQVLDPFCGTGTTLVECKKMGIRSVGIEANPVAHLASEVKVDWSPNAVGLMDHARMVAARALAVLQNQGIEDENLPLFRNGNQIGAVEDIPGLRLLSPEREKLLLTNSISPLPLHKTLVLLDCLEQHRDDRFHRHELVALAKALVYSISNLEFGPEVGVGPSKPDSAVIALWLAEVQRTANDLRDLAKAADTRSTVHHADARELNHFLRPGTIDAVITSPPYPNEKDYTRTTRLESVLLGFIRSKAELRTLKRSLVRSNTRGVYKEDSDDQLVAGHREIQRIATAIEKRRIELGKTSGFERMYARVTKLYFGGMARHLGELRQVLRPGAQLAYVVGDQASYLRIMIRTGQLLADIAQSLGYELVGIDLFRTRLATATKEQLREEVVVLRWPGNSSKGADCH